MMIQQLDTLAPDEIEMFSKTEQIIQGALVDNDWKILKLREEVTCASAVVNNSKKRIQIEKSALAIAREQLNKAISTRDELKEKLSTEKFAMLVTQTLTNDGSPVCDDVSVLADVLKRVDGDQKLKIIKRIIRGRLTDNFSTLKFHYLDSVFDIFPLTNKEIDPVGVAKLLADCGFPADVALIGHQLLRAYYSLQLHARDLPVLGQYEPELPYEQGCLKLVIDDFSNVSGQWISDACRIQELSCNITVKHDVAEKTIGIYVHCINDGTSDEDSRGNDNSLVRSLEDWKCSATIKVDFICPNKSSEFKIEHIFSAKSSNRGYKYVNLLSRKTSKNLKRTRANFTIVNATVNAGPVTSPSLDQYESERQIARTCIPSIACCWRCELFRLRPHAWFRHEDVGSSRSLLWEHAHHFSPTFIDRLRIDCECFV